MFPFFSSLQKIVLQSTCLIWDSIQCHCNIQPRKVLSKQSVRSLKNIQGHMILSLQTFLQKNTFCKLTSIVPKLPLGFLAVKFSTKVIVYLCSLTSLVTMKMSFHRNTQWGPPFKFNVVSSNVLCACKGDSSLIYNFVLFQRSSHLKLFTIVSKEVILDLLWCMDWMKAKVTPYTVIEFCLL